MAAILCKGLDGATPDEIMAVPQDFVPRIVGGDLVRVRSQTVYYILTRLKSACRGLAPARAGGRRIISMKKYSHRHDRRRRHRPRGRARRHPGAGGRRAQARFRPGLGPAALELPLLRRDRADDAGGRLRADQRPRRDLPRCDRLAECSGPHLALGATNSHSPEFPAIRQRPAGSPAGRGALAAARPRAGRDRFCHRAGKQRRGVFLDRRPDLPGHGRRDRDAGIGLHPPGGGQDHQVRLRAGPEAAEAASHLRDQVQRDHHHPPLLGRALQGGRGGLCRCPDMETNTTSTS